MKHKHAELMMEYAQDAMETDRPWERWEFKFDYDSVWKCANDHPSWFQYCEYRHKPITININGFEVPEPVRKPLSGGQRYWVVDIKYSMPVTSYTWDDGAMDYHNLDNGLIHLSEKATIKHADALISFTRIEK